MTKYIIALLILCNIGLIYAPASAQDNTKEEWTWRKGTDPDSVKRTRAELDSLISLHNLWEYDTTKGSRLELNKAHLMNVNLYLVNLLNCNLDSANLVNANLHGTKFNNSSMSFILLDNSDLSLAWLDSADLSNAIINNADLTHSHLTNVNLSNSDVLNTNLSGVWLSNADLSGVDFTLSNLSDADLTGASLMNVYLSGTILTKADFSKVNLQSAMFEPESLPNINNIALSLNLDELIYNSDPSKLIELREEFSKYGYKQQEREIICALKRHDANGFEWLFFDWTSEYGSNLNLPWIRLMYIYFICVFIYFLSMLSWSSSGINLVFLVTKDEDKQRNKDVYKNYFNFAKEKKVEVPIFCKSKAMKVLPLNSYFLKRPMIVRIIWWSLFFSSMCTFNIGFREINFGRWLKLLTRSEFDLQAFGWMRVVAGFQALISVYLIALWILSFAGTPFK